MAPIQWDIFDADNHTIGKFIQIPLRIAYALTIHSCQGSTLDYASIDLNGAFEYGHVYTALSRTRDSKSLFVANLDPNRIASHPQAIAFYNGLK